LFGDLYKAVNKDPELNRQLRAGLADKASRLAADFLPAGAYLNGKQLPSNHKIKTMIPIVEPQKKVETVVTPSRTARKSKPTKRQSRPPVTAQPQLKHQNV
jgi:hypothetical protein